MCGPDVESDDQQSCDVDGRKLDLEVRRNVDNGWHTGGAGVTIFFFLLLLLLLLQHSKVKLNK